MIGVFIMMVYFAMERMYRMRVYNRCDIISHATEKHCCICLERIVRCQSYTLLPCGHSNFHSVCLNSWSSNTCPICRFRYI
jgi:hypothetical protein